MSGHLLYEYAVWVWCDTSNPDPARSLNATEIASLTYQARFAPASVFDYETREVRMCNNQLSAHGM
jgi:hypothetical protein